jgi:hypothetical protein
MRFETRRMESFLRMVKAAKDLELDSSVAVCATGGGSRKYAAEITVWPACVCVFFAASGSRLSTGRMCFGTRFRMLMSLQP